MTFNLKKLAIAVIAVPTLLSLNSCGLGDGLAKAASEMDAQETKISPEELAADKAKFTELLNELTQLENPKEQFSIPWQNPDVKTEFSGDTLKLSYHPNHKSTETLIVDLSKVKSVNASTTWEFTGTDTIHTGALDLKMKKGSKAQLHNVESMGSLGTDETTFDRSSASITLRKNEEKLKELKKVAKRIIKAHKK